jgi:predicted  nucleic acid-binding Zn-ribbon protein
VKLVSATIGRVANEAHLGEPIRESKDIILRNGLILVSRAMNVEKTMEFILQQQAKAEVQMAAMREQQARSEKQQAEQHTKIDRQIAAIQKLITTGMKMIVKQGDSIRQLAEAQKVTETKLQGLIDVLRRGGNGSGRKH